MVDGDPRTFWKTDRYDNQANFGGKKPGMGVLIKFDQPTRVASVQVQMASAGASAQLRFGDTDPGNTSNGDKAIHNTYQAVGEPLLRHPGTTMVFPVDGKTEYQYLMIWFTELPMEASSGRYQVVVQEIAVQTP
jgi:hypothetical protein